MSFDDDLFPDDVVRIDLHRCDDHPAAVIGAAVGVIMAHLDLPYPEAFSLLRHTSEQTGRRLEYLAHDVVLSDTPMAEGIAALLDGRPLSGPPAAPLATVIRLARELDDWVPARLLDLLVVTTDLGEILGTVAEMAIDTVPGCSAASITVVHRGHLSTIGASDERAVAIDQAQYREGNGPCVDVVYSDLPMAMDDLAVHPHVWQQLAQEKGITAMVSVPIQSAANIAAALNLYTTRATKWPRRTLIAADALACYAGDAITLAYRMTHHDPKGVDVWAQLR